MRNHPTNVIPSPVAWFWRTAARYLLFDSRRVALCVIGLSVVLSLNVKAQEPVPLAHGNVPGEPHHHLKIENEYVRVYYVEAPPHESTLLHQHDHDYIYVSLGPSDVVNAIVNKPEIRLQLKDGETHFTRGGFAHVARNLADTPFRNITIELLHPQDHLQNLCKTVVQGEAGSCNKDDSASDGHVTEPWFETNEVRVEFIQLQRRAEFVQRVPAGCVYVSLDEGQLQDKRFGPSANMRPGDTVWVPGPTIVNLRNSKPNPSRFLVLWFKNAQRTRSSAIS